MRLLEFMCKLIGCFSYNFNIFYHSKKQHGIFSQIRFHSVFHILIDVMD